MCLKDLVWAAPARQGLGYRLFLGLEYANGITTSCHIQKFSNTFSTANSKLKTRIQMPIWLLTMFLSICSRNSTPIQRVRNMGSNWNRRFDMFHYWIYNENRDLSEFVDIFRRHYESYRSSSSHPLLDRSLLRNWWRRQQ